MFNIPKSLWHRIRHKGQTKFETVMKKTIVAMIFMAGALCSCNRNGLDPFNPFDPFGPDMPMPPGTEGSTYEFKTIEYDGLLATDAIEDIVDKSNTDIYWEGEAEDDGTFKNTITIEYKGDDVAVEMSKKSVDVYTYEKSGAHVVIRPKDGVEEVKKCEIILSGGSDNGSLKIYNTTNPDDKEAGKKTKLTLNGVSLKSTIGPAIDYQSGKRLFLHLADGTENSLEDATTYSDDIWYWPGKSAADEDRKGCFFSEKAVIVSGTGLLKVKGNYRHAISVDNDFYMRPGATVVVTDAAKNCLHCNDEIHFTGGYFYCSNTSAGGKIDVMAYDDAINAATTVTFNSGEVYALSTHNDGIDSNGDIYVSGGKITSIAANMEAALDNDNPGQNSTFKITGGEIIGIGGTVYSPSSSSTQYTIVYNGCPVSTIAELAVKDSDGNKILAITSPQGSQSSGVLLSSPKFIKDGKYTISIGDTTYQTATLSSIITTIGQQTGPGGGGGFGPGGPGGRPM